MKRKIGSLFNRKKSGQPEPYYPKGNILGYEFEKYVKVDAELWQQVQMFMSIDKVYEILQNEQRIKILKEGDIFGNFYPLTGNNWHRCYLLSEGADLGPSNLIEINCDQMLSLMEKSNENHHYRELLEFLKEHITGMEKASRVKRDRIARAFKEKTFIQGNYLMREGVDQHYAYLIMEGECLQVAQKNPLLSEVTLDGKIKQKNKINVMTNKGYQSHSTNQFKIGIIGRGCWIASELVL
mmetsp:Transcript_6017/g.5428  ORF Transcript_6017/g.5428 Transcript_6017/m.5428 type:complete len:239 (-) Transcript_6017:155-871(-)